MNYNDTKDTLMGYLKARIPFIIVNTVEKNRILKIVGEISETTQENIMIHSMSKGMKDIKTDTIVSDEKTLMGILTYISKDVETKRNVTYILTDVSDIEKDSLVSKYLFDLVNTCEEKSCSIVVVTDNEVWSNLKNLGMHIELVFPEEKEILDLLHKYLDSYSNQITIEWNEDDYKKASVVLLGLSEAEIKNVISILIAKGSINKEDLKELKYAKSKLFSNIEGLEKIDTDGVVYAGLDNLKTWLNSKKKLFDVKNKEKLTSRGIKPPRGLLVVGVPGCGKSLTAKAISQSWQMPLYLLDFATVQGMYVGQSEEQFKRALKTAEHLSPCILWIDEIEKGLSGVKDSSGVTNRMIGQFLFWLQECDKEVFVLATANDVDSLPAELIRKGRFDEIFFVDLPTTKERKELLELYFSKYLGVKLNDELINILIEKTNGFASSDIEAAIRTISYDVISDNLTLTKEYLINYFANCSSITKTTPERVEEIRNWCENRTLNASIKEQKNL